MNRRRRAGRFGIVAAATTGYLAGALVTAILLSGRDDELPDARGVATDDCGDARVVPDPAVRPRVEPASRVDPVSRPAPPPAAAGPRLSADPVAELRRRDLLIPVKGVDTSKLYGSFADKRGVNRRHEAIDILAPRGTPVLAVESGVIAKLHFSEAGGVTVYQYDPTESYVYYYAHLDRYAAGLKNDDPIESGQVLGYVGTTGNAPENTPHLHFAIFRLSSEKRWWEGTPIDPFEILKN
jgi:murein DD-endopeptidase MepM/ murein hydrolase activator NlpD